MTNAQSSGKVENIPVNIPIEQNISSDKYESFFKSSLKTIHKLNQFAHKNYLQSKRQLKFSHLSIIFNYNDLHTNNIVEPIELVESNKCNQLPLSKNLDNKFFCFITYDKNKLEYIIKFDELDIITYKIQDELMNIRSGRGFISIYQNKIYYTQEKIIKYVGYCSMKNPKKCDFIFDSTNT